MEVTSFSVAPGGLDQLVDRGRQLVVLDDDGLDDEVRLEPDLLQALQVGRIGGGDVEPVAALVQRQNVPRLGNLEVDQLFRELVGVESRKVEQRDAERARREHRELVRRDLLAGDDVVDKRGPGLLRLRLQRLGLEFRHEPVLRERASEAADVARRCGVRGHGLGFASGGLARVREASRASSNSCAVSATTCRRRHYSKRIKLIRTDDACPSALCKGAAGGRPTGGSSRTTFTPRSCVCSTSIDLAGDVDARAGIGYLAQLRHDEPVQGLRAIHRKVRAELAIQRPQRRQPVDDHGAVGAALVGIGPVGRLRREIADDLLDDVLDRHQADEFAVFVDDETQPLAVGLELLQLGEQRRARPARNTPGAGSSGARPARCRRRAAGARPASGGRRRRCCRARPRRRAAACGRTSRAAARSATALVGEIERVDLVARGHHVVDGHRLEVEQVREHGAMLAAEVLPLQHERAQLLLRSASSRRRSSRSMRSSLRSALDEQVDEPDDRRGRLQHRRQQVAHDGRDAVGVRGADHLRRDLREHEDQRR